MLSSEKERVDVSNRMDAEVQSLVPLPKYRVSQKGVVGNIAVTDFDSLVTHHPGDNSNARVVNGVVLEGERTRIRAVVDSKIESHRDPN